jgi:hypothetical protein
MPQSFTCVNLPGHYEGNGFEVNVFPTQIVVTMKWQNQNKPRQQQNHREPEPRKTDDGNMSLLSSVGKIAQAFKKKS